MNGCRNPDRNPHPSEQLQRFMEEDTAWNGVHTRDSTGGDRKDLLHRSINNTTREFSTPSTSTKEEEGEKTKENKGQKRKEDKPAKRKKGDEEKDDKDKKRTGGDKKKVKKESKENK